MGRSPIDAMDNGGVDLPDLRQRPQAAVLGDRAHRFQKQRAIAFDVSVGVVLGLPEVERPATVPPRNSALASAETMHQPRHISEYVGAKNLDGVCGLTFTFVCGWHISILVQFRDCAGGYNRLAMLLYYITDRKDFTGTESDQHAALLRRIAEAARAGVDYIQLREKDLSLEEFQPLAREAVTAVRANSAATKLLINSHSDIAIAVGADGVHLPAGFPPADEIRDQWLRHSDREPIIGVSAHSVEDDQAPASCRAIRSLSDCLVRGCSGAGDLRIRQAFIALRAVWRRRSHGGRSRA